LQKAYEAFGFKKGDFPVTEKVAVEILSLPMYPQLQPTAQTRVVQKIQEFAPVGALR
jgi:dTDP-4-amino-4,6-dideoxygalactose transaminase